MTGVYAALLVVLGLALIAGVAAVGVTAYRVRGVGEPEHEGATADSPPLIPVDSDAPTELVELDEVEDTGRHHIGRVDSVPPGWAPPIGRHRIAAITDDTQAIRIDDIEEQQP